MVIVQTCKRPNGVSYLADTLRSIGNVKNRRKLIVSDGPLPDGFVRPDDWQVAEYPWRGSRSTGWTCLFSALSAGVKDVILLQDDIAVCEGGAEVMHHCAVPENCVAVTFYSGSALPGLEPKNPGFARMIVIGASGTAQALKFPRRAIEYLCRRDPRAAANISPNEPHLFDDSLFALARESPFPHVGHLVPNIVRHIGTISACGTRRAFNQPWSVRRGETFPGDLTKLPVHEVRYK